MGTKNLPPREWIFGFPVIKLTDEVTDVERSESIIEKYSDEPSLNGLKGELETAVSQYLSQVKGLGIFKDDNPRDKPCQFTTFKTPALPKKTLRPTSLPDEQLLDVKFKLTEDPPGESLTYENSDIKSRCVDNPLYVSLSDCSTGNTDNSKEGYYENISSDISDEDHIYENVDAVLQLYDTVANPPRPKLPPKVGTLSKKFKEIGDTRNFYAILSQSPHERYTIPNKNPVKLKGLINQSEDGENIDGSETSDLGSSGTEDTNSVEDWPLPPYPLETVQTTEDKLLPPPPPLPPPRAETALQKLEDKVLSADTKPTLPKKTIIGRTCSKEERESNYYTGVIFRDTSHETKSLDYNTSNIPLSELNDKNSQFFRTESFSKKHLKSKLFTLNKGLHAYNKATKSDTQLISPKFIVVDSEPKKSDSAVRHSVIIELKGPNSSAPTSLQPSDVEIKEKLETIKIESSKIHRSDSISLDIKQSNNDSHTSRSNNTVTEIFNEQIIEISDDGSWEMKDSLNSISLESSTSQSSADIDPFTGFPIMSPLPVTDSVVKPKDIVQEYVEPDVYFDNKIKSEDDSDLPNTVAKTKALLEASFTRSDEKINSGVYIDGHKIDEDITPDTSIINKESTLAQNAEETDENAKNQKHNLGAAIMEGYEKDRQRKKDNLNLPEVSLLEFGDTVKDLEQERKNVIDQMTVKARKKDSWIRNFRSPIEAVKDVTSSVVGKDTATSVLEGISLRKKIFENKDEKVAKSKQISFSFNRTQKQETENQCSKVKVQSSSTKDRTKSLREDSVDKKFINKYIEQVNKKEVKKDRKLLQRLSFLSSNNTIKIKDKEEGRSSNDEKIKKPASEVIKGEVDSESILNKKAETKSYWETKMLAVDDSGWEPVANVKFRSDMETSTENGSSNAVPPPPEFSAENGTNFESLSSEEASDPPSQTLINERPSRQYMYGSDEEIKKTWNANTDTPVAKRTSSHENVIEAEIREQQLREEAIRRENDLRNREKTGGASSPSSHASDEGFVERPIEEVPSPPLTSSSPSEGFTHAIKGHDGETIIYDAVSPSSEYFPDKNVSTNGSSSEAKIALEIRELKEREAELRALRELREREQQLRAMRDSPQSRNLADEGEEDVELEIERGSASSREMLDDHLASFTTTTDEGNFSECGDPASSEDKSSEGSNSRIMSPDLHPYGTHTEPRPRKVTVKPFEDEEAEPQPVYTQMKKESVIEREIRLAKEREEAFRLEKGLLPLPSSTPEIRTTPQTTHSSNTLPITKNATKVSKNAIEEEKVDVSKEAEEPPKRKVQHRLATNRIQQEIEETAQRERELQSAGKIKTLSEDTVDSKVTRLSDFISEQESSTIARASSISSLSSFSSLHSSPAKGSLTNGHATLSKGTSSPVTPSSPYSPPPFISSTNKRPVPQIRLTRSLSTNNLSLAGNATSGLRIPQKGLMQKFIASRGKMTTSAFGPPSTSVSFNGISKPLSIISNGIPTRPMRISPKTPVISRGNETNKMEEPTTKIFRRTHATAEEKIQEELRDMKQREEELRRIRKRNLARSQPNLAGFDDDVDDDTEAPTSEGVDSSSFLHEMNGLRSALSNPNLLDEESEQPQPQIQQTERGVRRRSALIAQWEGRIQQTADS